jgi:hypothetical protein
MTKPLGVFALAVVAMLSTQPATARAQVTLPTVGERVRMQLRGGERVTGVVRSLAGDTLDLLTGRADWRIARAEIEQLEVSMGRDRGRGAAWGALAGGILGAGLIIVGLVADSHPNDATFPSTALTLPAAAITTTLGAGIGFLLGPEQWGPPTNIGVDLRPSSRRLQVGFSFTP